MNDSESGWGRGRSEELRATLSDTEIEELAKRAKSDPKSLSLDELGVLFLVTRERIRATERKGGGPGGGRS
jgi:DNA-directed RNA polymerase sigma subunit (sigma70/sigma32)